MRLYIIAMVLSGSAAFAQAPSVAEQYAAAREAFTAGLVGPGEYQLDYPVHVLEGVDGTWYRASAFDRSRDDAEMLARACARGDRIRRLDDFTFALTRGAGDAAATTTFTSAGGSLFTTHTPLADVVARLRPRSDDDTLRAVQSFNGPAMIVRPSPEILVIWEGMTSPDIYARCPA